jgi:hypothetical protein
MALYPLADRCYNPTRDNILQQNRKLDANLYLSRDARVTESLGQMVNVGLIAEGEPSNMLRKGVLRIDLHQLATSCTVKKTLANREPSTHGTSRKWCPSRLAAAHGYEADSVYELTPQYVTA